MCLLEEAAFQPNSLKVGDSSLSFKFHPHLSGEYFSDDIRIEIVDRFGLVVGEREISFHLAFRVYPRVLAVAVEAAYFLLQAGTIGYGDQPIQLKGSGLEYAESRLYVPGDSLAKVDWKATARLGRLVVKDYYVEGGVGVHVVYEASASDSLSLDVLTVNFLQVVLTFARAGQVLGLTVHDGEEVLFHDANLSPGLVVAQAMQFALKGCESGFEQLYAVLEPRAALNIRSLFEGVEDTSLSSVLGADSKTSRIQSLQPYDTLNELVETETSSLRLVVISSLQGDPVPLLELARLTQSRGWLLQVIQPTQPWLSSEDLKGSYLLWEHNTRVNRALRRMGVIVTSSVGELQKFLMKLGSEYRQRPYFF